MRLVPGQVLGPRTGSQALGQVSGRLMHPEKSAVYSCDMSILQDDWKNYTQENTVWSLCQ